jgi:SAM-dependent methyltransferase
MCALTLDERLTAATTGALELFGVYLGTRLGLYRGLAGSTGLTPGGLANRAGIHPRYAREWLEQQAVSGFLEVDDLACAAEDRRYRLPSAHEGALSTVDDPAHVAPFADMVVGIAQVLDDVVAAYRDGTGVPYSRYGENFRRGQGGINRPAFSSDLTGTWLPAIPHLHSQLSRPGARIADVGCGHGWSTIALADAYPGADVLGIDDDPASIQQARSNAAAASSTARYLEADGASLIDHGPFDAVLLLESLHDMARPVDTLTACRKALQTGGAVVVVDEKVAPTFTAPGDLVERMMYGWSISHCLPAAMTDPAAAALGTVLRAGTLDALAADAGFGSVRAVDVDAGFFRVYLLED